MKAYFEVDQNNLPINTDVMSAIEGFQNLAYDIKTFKRTELLTESKYQNLSKENVFVGSIDSIKYILKKIDKYPEPIDFPYSIIKSGLNNC